VAFRVSTVAIRASSCVNLSNLLSASSKSVLPTSFLKYFSERHRSLRVSAEGSTDVKELRTRSALLDLLRRDPEDR
jgi:hypothetical protein